MKILRSIAEMRAWGGDHRSARIGFVPTMGALHHGHLVHLDALSGRVDKIVASVFVNPTQFGANEDFARYPRDLDRDAELLRTRGCDVLFAPEASEIYPQGFATYVEVAGLSDRYEGESRPDHFKGVTTVVCKLLNLVDPDVVTFGQKDAQQVAVVKRMIRDLDFRCEVLVIPTVREGDYVAASSRNVYLNEDERREATSIHRALHAGRDAYQSGLSIHDTIARMREVLSPMISIDYLDVVDPYTFRQITDRDNDGEILAIVAGRLGKTRLIDNLSLDDKATVEEREIR